MKRHVRRDVPEYPVNRPLKQQRIAELKYIGLTRTNMRPLDSVVEKYQRGN